MPNKKVLIIDDEKIVRISCKRVLEQEGYDVTLAVSAEEGLEFLEQASYDLVITDLIMPGIDGFELLKIIKQRWPELCVVVMTGYCTSDAGDKSFELGASEFLKKPFLPEQLLMVADNHGSCGN